MLVTMLNGVLLPLMAVWFIPNALKKNDYISHIVLLNLLIVFSVTIAIHFDSKGMEAFALAIFNCFLVYLGALVSFYFKNKKLKDKDN
jgi:phosphotransferase system  glucose/maltose/N-acetylglucosamine-specific IIC component